MHDQIRPVMPVPEDDHEGSMARSELYRAAKYSMKLFQMIQDGQDLEGWVQAKITKSADYLDSVYHYMEYQVKFGDGSHASNIDDITGDADHEMPSDEPVSDMDDEERKIDEMTTYEQKLEALLEGAMKKVKGKKAEDKKEDDLDEAKIQASGVRASDKKKGKVDKSERKQYFVKLEKDNKTKGMTIVADEGESEGELRDRVKRDNSGWTVASMRVKDEIDEAAEKIAKAEKAAKNKKEKDEMIKEALTQVVEKAVSKAQQKFMGMVHAAKKGEKPASKEVEKAAKGMSKKSAEDFASTKHKGLPEKKAKKTDEGQVMSPPDGATAPPPKDPKTGKYPKVTSGPNKGKEWSEKTPGPTNPSFKEEQDLVKSIVKKVVAEKKAGGKKPDFLDMDKDGDKQEPMKKAVADKKKETVKESADLSRLKFLSGL